MILLKHKNVRGSGMRDYVVTVINETFPITAPNYYRAKWLGCKAYLKRHPNSAYKISELSFSRKVSVKVVNDGRVRY